MAINSSLRLASLVGKRAPQAFSRTMVYLMCLTLVLSGIIPPGLAMAQVNVEQVVSLKEVPVPAPMAAVIVGPIPGPGTDLNFQPLTADIVKDQAALIRLGKALFWDMQMGSDAVQACATCHYNAGADNRPKNQVSPGLADTNFTGGFLSGDNSFGNATVPYTANDPNTPRPPGPSQPPPAGLNVDGFPQFTTNYQLLPTDFPLNDWFRATAFVPRGPGVTLLEELEGVSRDTNDVIGSQGVRHTQFVAVVPGSAVDQGTTLPDIFNVLTPGAPQSAGLTRRVTGRNAPTAINACFNFDNFWDGRASFIFNGVNPFGFRDRTSTLKRNDAGVLKDVFIRVSNSSLASQAVGPPGSDMEMSWAGRTFPDIGKKMVSLRPLAQQMVHPHDSVLGPVSRDPLPGLNFNTYTDMIQAAFQDQWWNSPDVLTLVPRTKAVQKASTNDPRNMVVSPGKAVKAPGTRAGATRAGKRAPLLANQYTQMQWNFSMFFGLAVQAYEQTLVSDDTPFDRFNGAFRPIDRSTGNVLPPIPPDPFALTDMQRLGLSIFLDSDPVNGAKCLNCHVPPVTTSHTVLDNQPSPQGVPGGGEGEAIEFMIMGDNLQTANYDHGMYNIGVRRTTEDAGRAGTAPNGPPFLNPLNNNQPFPLSIVELAALRQQGKLPPDVARFVPNEPILPRRVTNGAFKVPNLRNTKFTGPYFHNGDSATLRQVVEFYTRGGNFPNTNLHDKTVDVDGIPPLMFPEFSPSAQENIQALVDFLAEGLTDQRVAYERAPFDHPQLFIPTGQDSNQTDIMLEIPAVGQGGRGTPIPTFLNLDPQAQ